VDDVAKVGLSLDVGLVGLLGDGKGNGDSHGHRSFIGHPPQSMNAADPLDLGGAGRRGTTLITTLSRS
jgi:hypothetical protein